VKKDKDPAGKPAGFFHSIFFSITHNVLIESSNKNPVVEDTPKSTLLNKTENQNLPLTLKAGSLIFIYFTL